MCQKVFRVRFPLRDEVVGSAGHFFRQLDVLDLVLDLVLLDRLQHLLGHNPCKLPFQQRCYDELHVGCDIFELRADHREQHAVLDHGKCRRERDRVLVDGQHLARQPAVLHGRSHPRLLGFHGDEELPELLVVRTRHRRLGRRRPYTGLHCNREVLDFDDHPREHLLLGVFVRVPPERHRLPEPPAGLHHFHLHRDGRAPSLRVFVDRRQQILGGRGSKDDMFPEVHIGRVVEVPHLECHPQRDPHQHFQVCGPGIQLHLADPCVLQLVLRYQWRLHPRRRGGWPLTWAVFPPRLAIRS
mmetsp:Transcript_94870/g.290221  ORF Transcript_94870/g.290221 Transcript_94870/m.290221 type:complete len:299 (+) Transcript_94870:1769-2665(+)